MKSNYCIQEFKRRIFLHTNAYFRLIVVSERTPCACRRGRGDSEGVALMRAYSHMCIIGYVNVFQFAQAHIGLYRWKWGIAKIAISYSTSQVILILSAPCPDWSSSNLEFTIQLLRSQRTIRLISYSNLSITLKQFPFSYPVNWSCDTIASRSRASEENRWIACREVPLEMWTHRTINAPDCTRRYTHTDTHVYVRTHIHTM